jgi:hypothetical protein
MKEAGSDKHTFQQRHKYMSEEQYHDQLEKTQERVKRFEWDDKKIEEGEDSQPSSSTDQVKSCIKAVVVYCCKHMSLNDYTSDSWSLRVQVPSTVHPLLQERFNCSYNLDSRFKEFDKIRADFENSCLHPELKSKLDEKVQRLFPQEGLVGYGEIDGKKVGGMTKNPVSSWEVVNAVIDDENDLIMGVGDEDENSLNVTFELVKSASEQN